MMGSIQRLNVNLDNIYNAGTPELASALKALVEAVSRSGDLRHEQKAPAIEQIGYLAEEAAKPVAQRNRSVASTVLQSLRSVLGVAADVASVWGPGSALLGGLFRQ